MSNEYSTANGCRLLRFQVAVIVLFLLAACQARQHTGPPVATSSYHDHSGHIAEFQRATERLRLPAGAAWPALPASKDEPARFAYGAGTTRAELYWLCQWEKEWLSARLVDPVRAAAALHQIEQVKGLQVYTVALDDAGRTQVRESIARAERDDPSGIQADVNANCR